MSKTVIDIDNFELINIPTEAFKCPICDEALYISEIDEWSKDDGENIVPEHFSIDCVSMPDFEDPEWEDWHKWHYSMPYVDWLPLEEPIKKWLMDNFEFIESGNEQEKLERWKKSDA